MDRQPQGVVPLTKAHQGDTQASKLVDKPLDLQFSDPPHRMPQYVALFLQSSSSQPCAQGILLQSLVRCCDVPAEGPHLTAASTSLPPPQHWAARLDPLMSGRAGSQPSMP